MDSFFAVTAFAFLVIVAYAALVIHEQAKEIKRLNDHNTRGDQRTNLTKGQLAAFDHDGDGRPGGSRKRA